MPINPVLLFGGLAPSLSLNFLAGTLDSRITFTRASSATYFDSAGILQTASTDAARFDYNPTTLAPRGLLIEESRTNVCLWNRDLTNAAWTKSNVTAAKDQVGIDGVSNSASSITATAGNGTCLQAITLASSARYQSAYIKRITGSGVINMTTDNGATWTPITVTSSWTRVEIPTQTLANPTVGFRIVTNGDAVAIDYVQNENGTFATSAIATTTTSVTRAADVATITTLTPWYNASVGTLLVTCATAYAGDTSSNKGVAAFTDGTLNNSIVLRHGVGNTAGMLVNTGGVTQANFGSGAWTNTSVHKFATAWAVNDFASYFDGVATGTDTAGTIPTVTQLELGRYTTGGTLCGWLQSLRYYPTRLPNATLQALTL